jgi:hypothetical protein
MINNVFYKPPEEKIKSSQIGRVRGAREWVLLLLLSNDQEIPCPERHKHSWRSEMVHHLTAKLFPQ